MKYIAKQMTNQGSNIVRLIEQGELPPARTMRDLFPGLVIECDRPARDEPWCDIAEREGAYIGDGDREMQERNWLRSKLGMKPLILTGEAYVEADEHEG